MSRRLQRSARAPLQSLSSSLIDDTLHIFSIHGLKIKYLFAIHRQTSHHTRYLEGGDSVRLIFVGWGLWGLSKYEEDYPRVPSSLFHFICNSNSSFKSVKICWIADCLLQSPLTQLVTDIQVCVCLWGGRAPARHSTINWFVFVTSNMWTNWHFWHEKD